MRLRKVCREMAMNVDMRRMCMCFVMPVFTASPQRCAA